MVNFSPFIQLHVNPSAESPLKATLLVAQPIIDTLHNYITELIQGQARVDGFAPGQAPVQYIKTAYQPVVQGYVKEFLLRHPIRKCITQGLHQCKIIGIGEPLLISCEIDPAKEGCFEFIVAVLQPQPVGDWRKLYLKAPERKNYKDLDRQVELFLKEESEKATLPQADAIQPGDWVNFELCLQCSSHACLQDIIDTLWIKIGDEDADRIAQETFVGKKIGDTLCGSQEFLQEYFGHTPCYNVCITIKNIVSPSYFSIEQFKKQFRLKTGRELHQKLIEVFSFRNDISQRRETIEAAYKTLMPNFTIDLSNDLIEYQQEAVLAILRLNPDYYVYKAQKDFKEKVRGLAIKQLKELAITDYIALHENIQVTEEDIHCYLNLLKRPRTKEFIYFEFPTSKVNGQEATIPAELLQLYCLREKTLNAIIYQLTKK